MWIKEELIDEKVDDDYIFVWKNKSMPKCVYKFWSRFVTLP